MRSRKQQVYDRPDWAIDVSGDYDPAWDAVTESTPPPENDSVTLLDADAVTPDLGVTESTHTLDVGFEPTEDDSVTSIHDDSVTGGQCDRANKAVNQYKPGGTARGGHYFRFSYKERGRVKHVHIPGGSVDSTIAQQHARAVALACNSGKSNQEIIALIRSWTRCRRQLPPF